MSVPSALEILKGQKQPYTFFVNYAIHFSICCYALSCDKIKGNWKLQRIINGMGLLFFREFTFQLPILYKTCYNILYFFYLSKVRK
jgi:hypothetical protein